MIFSMDELGLENNEAMMQFRGEAQKWEFILSAAREYGFDGIHVTPSLYHSFGLDVNRMPGEFDQFHLTYHLGGAYRILHDRECFEFERVLDDAFQAAQKHHMRDISLHPPVIEGFSGDEKKRSEQQFSKIIRKWSRDIKNSGFTLSLETHMYEPYFLFGDYSHYKAFMEAHPDMGILIDVSHNFFSGYAEQDMIDTFRNRPVTALHVSDAIRLKNEDMKSGTHLAIGDGKMNFGNLLNHYAENEMLFAVLEIKAANRKLADSLAKLKQMLMEN